MKKQTKKVMAMVLALMMMPANGGVYASQKVTEQEGNTKEYIVVSKSDTSYNKITEEYSADKSEYTESMGNVNISVNTMTESQAKTLEDKSSVLSVEENFTLEGCGKKSIEPKDISSDWNVKMINADKKKYSSKTRKKVEKYEKKAEQSSAKVKIAIIDSGVDETGDIEIKERCNLVPEDEGLSPCFEDNTGHGTAIAGIIGSVKDGDTTVSGIDTNAEIYSIKVMDSDNTAPVSRIIEGIYRAMEYDVDIINMSFGTTYNSEVLHKAIKDAYEAGILMVAAAGNRGCEDGKVEYPAAYDEVMAVGSVDAGAELAEESSRGEQVDVLAPGELVRTLTSFGLETVSSGTSIAAPHVSAMAAVLWERDRSKSADFIRGLIENSANEIRTDGRTYGVADLGYAQEIYDEYAKNYTRETYAVTENKNEIEVDEQTAKVAARWSRANHVKLTSEAITASGKKLTDIQIALLKAGSRYNDDENSDYQILHSLGTDTNYIAATFYMGKIIQASNCNPSKVKIMLDLTTTQRNQINNAVNNLSWKEIKKKYSVLNNLKETDTRKRFVLFGMSLHIITDAFAHRSYGVVNGKWQHVPGGKANKADDATFLKSRFNAAGQVVKNAISICLNVDEPIKSYTIRCNTIADNKYFDGTFKLKDLYFYALANSSNDSTFVRYEKKLAKNTDTGISGYNAQSNDESEKKQYKIALEKEIILKRILSN